LAIKLLKQPAIRRYSDRAGGGRFRGQAPAGSKIPLWFGIMSDWTLRAFGRATLLLKFIVYIGRYVLTALASLPLFLY